MVGIFLEFLTMNLLFFLPSSGGLGGQKSVKKLSKVIVTEWTIGALVRLLARRQCGALELGSLNESN